MGRNQRYIHENLIKTSEEGTWWSWRDHSSKLRLVTSGFLELGNLGKWSIEREVGSGKLKMEGNGREREGNEWNEGVGFLNVQNIFKNLVGSGRACFINVATSPRRRSVEAMMVPHLFRHVFPSFENNWKTYLAWRIHAMGRRWVR